MATKRTHEEFLKILHEKGGGEYELLPGEIYQNNKHKLRMKHLRCNTEFSVAPLKFMKGQHCPTCTKETMLENRRKKKLEEFQNYLNSVCNQEYRISTGETYKKSTIPIRLVHEKCGQAFSVRVHEFKKRNRCPCCQEKKAAQEKHENFLRKLHSYTNGEYEAIPGEVYKNAKTPIKIRHKVCGYEYFALPYLFFRKKVFCPVCIPENKCPVNLKKVENIEQLRKRIRNVNRKEYTVVDTSNLTNNKSYITVRHDTCGHVYNVKVCSYLAGSRCPECAKKSSAARSKNRKSHEQFLSEFKTLGNNEYELLPGEIYKNNSTKLKVKHKICGHIYEVSPSNFLKGRRCPKCNRNNGGRATRKTHETFVSEVQALTNGEYLVLDTYQRSDLKVRMKHRLCGYEWAITPAAFLHGTRCPKCGNASKGKRKTLEEFKQEVQTLVGEEYTVKEGEIYKNNKEKITMIHRTCGNEYKVTPKDFLRGRRCPFCRQMNRSRLNRKSVEELEKEILEAGKGEYKIRDTSAYVNSDTPIEMLHLACGYTWPVTPSSFLKGTRCPRCNGGVKKAHDAFIEELERERNGEYILVPGERYINSKTPIKFRHRKCGTEFSAKPENLKTFQCPECFRMSRGELFIKEFLERSNIPYIYQYSIEECKYKRSLRFDFAVLSNKGRLIGLIEYNGLQHYQPINYFGGEEAHLLVKMRDKLKRTFCKRHGIPLIEIRYDEDLEQKLSSALKKLDLPIHSII